MIFFRSSGSSRNQSRDQFGSFFQTLSWNVLPTVMFFALALPAQETRAQDSIDWDATSSTSWDATTDNWIGDDTTYSDGDDVTFGDDPAGGGPNTVTLNTSVATGSITFENTEDYTFNDLVADSETISATGGISINGTSTGNITIDAKITGSTNITHDGTGTLTLGGGGVTNDFTGNIVIKNGATLRNGDDTDGNLSSLGAAANTLTVESGGTFDLNALAAGASLKGYGTGSISIEGSGVDGLGALVNNGTEDARDAFADELIFTGNVTLGGSGRFDLDDGFKVSGTNITITKEGNATILIAGDQSGESIANWEINDGAIFLLNDSALGTAKVTLNTDGILRGNIAGNSTRTIANNIDLNGGTIQTGYGAGSVTDLTGTITLDADSDLKPGTDDRLIKISGTVKTGDGGDLNIGTGEVQIAATSNLTDFSGNFRLIQDNTILSIANGVTLSQAIVAANGGDNKMFELQDSGGANGIGTVSGSIQLRENDGVSQLIVRAYDTDTLTLSGLIFDGTGTANMPININGRRTGDTAGSTSNGTVIFTEDNTYKSETIVTGGTLLVNGDQTAATGVVTVGDGATNNATLGGSGTIGGNTTVHSGSTLSGGTNGNVGTLTFAPDTGTTNLTAESGSTWLVDLIGGSGNSGTSDRIVVSGNLDITGSTIQINDLGTYTFGDKFTIATYGTLTANATFNGWADDSLHTIGGGTYMIDYNDGSAITLTAIPEPGTWLGLALLLGCAFLYRRRERLRINLQAS
ncbi:MAG: PEP-CTERM sorting domain-containing protein [Verrucomicrobiales bacterium]|nr:PEP-CTERM sorting domain-containing protein [Verrucomicrobiales bacterium]